MWKGGLFLFSALQIGNDEVGLVEVYVHTKASDKSLRLLKKQLHDQASHSYLLLTFLDDGTKLSTPSRWQYLMFSKPSIH